MKVIEDLSDFHPTKQKILTKLAREGEELSGLGQIAEEVDRAESTTSGHLADLSDGPYVEEEKMGRKKKWELTERGKDLLLNSPLTLDSPNSDQEVTQGQDQGTEFSLHNFSGKIKIENLALLNDDWKERLVKRSEKEWEHDSTNDTYYTWVKEWKIRLTGEAVVVLLTEELKDSTPEIVKNRGMKKLDEAREWVEDQFPIRLSNQVQTTIKVSTQHIARVQDPICEYIKKKEDWNLSDVEVEDSSGTIRLWFDDSHGESHREGGNSPGQNRNDPEDDQEKVEDFLQGLIEDEYSSEEFSWLSDFSSSNPERRMKVMEKGIMAMIVKELGSSGSQRQAHSCGCCCGHQEDDQAQEDSLEDRLHELQGKMADSEYDIDELEARMKARIRKMKSRGEDDSDFQV